VTCPNAPQCCAPSFLHWTATSTDPANVEAFTADVVAEMRRTGSRNAGKVAAAVYAKAMAEAREGCVLS
jgi:hypothetical protein